MAAAGQWGPARRHVEALQRCLALKASGPAAAAAEQVAGWRATCLVRASLTATPRVGEDMNRLLAELSTPRAKVRLQNPTEQPRISSASHVLDCDSSTYRYWHLQLALCASGSACGMLVRMCEGAASNLYAVCACVCRRVLQAHAWLAFAHASTASSDHMAARKVALTALQGHPLDQVSNGSPAAVPRKP
jgi:hypothetical protein